LHVTYTEAAPTATTLSDFLNGLAAVFDEALVPLMDAETATTFITGTDLTSDTAAQVTISNGFNGTREGAVLPASIAALVNYNSSFRYRGGHPRTYYLVGVETDVLDQSTWTDAFTALVQTAATDILNACAAGAVAGTNYTGQCAVSYRHADAARVTPVVMPIAVATASSGIASQRRRMRRR
jgi:hypothetical protein